MHKRRRKSFDFFKEVVNMVDDDTFAGDPVGLALHSLFLFIAAIFCLAVLGSVLKDVVLPLGIYVLAVLS